jgi:hypothetical protein
VAPLSEAGSFRRARALSRGTAPGAPTAGTFCAGDRHQLQEAAKDGPLPGVLPEGRMHGPPPGEGGHVPSRPASKPVEAAPAGPGEITRDLPVSNRPYCTIANGRVSGNRSPVTRTKSGNAHEVETARPSNITAGAAGPRPGYPAKIGLEDENPYLQ